MDRLYFTAMATVAIALACLSSVDANVFSMGKMIEWLDPKLSSIFGAYGRFNDYGCYCGLGGSGTPIDQVDCCCQAHDECYEALVDDGHCTAEGTMGHLYSFKKIRVDGKPQLQCKPSPEDQCAFHLCQCDVMVATCLAANEPHYNNQHHHYDRQSKCDRRKGLRAAICEN